jgi:spore germination protein PE
MIPRTSDVNHIHIRSVLFSSIVNVGDTVEHTAFSRAIAIQKYEPEFNTALSNLIDYPKYQIFTMVRPPAIPPKEVVMESYHDPAFIKVNSIDIFGISTAAMLHIGGIQNIDLESRVKHVRDYRTNPDPKNLSIVPFAPVSRNKREPKGREEQP